MDLKCPAFSRGPTDIISFLGPNHAESRTRVGALRIPWLGTGREEKEKGKKKKTVVPSTNTSLHNVNLQHPESSFPKKRGWAGPCSILPTTQLTPASQLPSVTSPSMCHFFLAVWGPTAIVNDYPSCGSNRNQIAPKITVVSSGTRGSTMWFDLCHPPPKDGTTPLEGYIALPSGSFPRFVWIFLNYTNS